MSDDPASEGWVQGEQSGLPVFLRPLWTREEPTGPAFAFEAKAELCNARGVIHGGMLATMMDHTLGLTARVASGGITLATIQLDLNYVAAASPGGLIEGRGEVVRRTSSLVFLRGVLTQRGAVVLSASGIWKAIRPR
jgi:uncharacterized protein (TIGR00369 family)